MKTMPALACCCAIALMVQPGALSAQTETRSTPLYRCGPDGRDLRDSPCPEPRAAETLKYEQPSAAQVREARERSQQTQAQADAMERERLKREAAARREAPLATGIQGRRGAAAPQPAASAATGAKPKSGKPKKTKPAPKSKAGPGKP